MNGKHSCQRVVLVLGIHRSGTSALTKGLETMGVSLGDSLRSINSINEKGSSEDLEFSNFNIAILDSLGASIYRILPLTEKEVALLCQKGFLTKASQLLLKKLPSFERLGIKDPKFSILLPFWKKVFHACNIDVSFVISLRDPWSVSSSAKVSLKIKDQERSIWLWISYLLSCLEHTEGYERILVNYKELLKNPEHQMKRIAHALQLTIDQEQLQIYCHDLIDSSLCHFQEEKKYDCDNSFHHQFVMEIYGQLLTIAKDQASFHDIKNSLEKWKTQVAEARSLFVLLEKNNRTIKELEQTIMEREQTIFGLNTTINGHSYSIAGLCQTIHRQNLQLASLIQEQTKCHIETLQWNLQSNAQQDA